MNQLLLYKKQIILQGPPGTGKTKLAKEIAKSLINGNIIFNITENNILSFFKLNQEILGRKESTKYVIKEINKDSILLSTTGDERSPTKKQIYESYIGRLWLKSSEERKSNTLSYADSLAKNLFNRFKDIKNNNFYEIIQFHPSYTYEDFIRGIVAAPNDKGEGIIYKAEDRSLIKLANDAKDNPDNNYVLIIDEINRANLSSVLGELIYALEYRGKEVDSLYEIDGEGNKITLPSNLYIIGTMNTADRSVGHIDYAIRRRFAFVEVLPKELKDDKIIFHQDWFRKVSELFIENYDEYVANDKVALKRAKTLSGEFRPEDVWIGHSYFIQKKLENGSLEPDDFRIRVDYEIKPILLEYVKDGVLTGKVGALTIEDYIKYL
ncbi:AAA family ATPase [Elizabethkingia anophelis]|nr:AAA family ATPase [Elizabethkingia anophelis]MCT4205300.1 AAA family ATPase [Elizabethkingia anophelis]MCT4208814.1 AAA family ATPase [Elizabethkingia anophelis]